MEQASKLTEDDDQPQPKNPWHERILGMIDGPAREYSPHDAVDLRAPDIPWY